MTGMTPGQLAEIRGRVDRNSHPLGDRAALLDEVDRLRSVVADYEQVIPLALRGGLAEHTDDDCAICNHATHGQVIDSEVDRLRNGIEELAAELAADIPYDSGNATANLAAGVLRALLNPTEGEK